MNATLRMICYSSYRSVCPRPCSRGVKIFCQNAWIFGFPLNMGCHFALKRILCGNISRLPSWSTALNAAWMESGHSSQCKSCGIQCHSTARLSACQQALQWDRLQNPSTQVLPNCILAFTACRPGRQHVVTSQSPVREQPTMSHCQHVQAHRDWAATEPELRPAWQAKVAHTSRCHPCKKPKGGLSWWSSWPWCSTGCLCHSLPHVWLKNGPAASTLAIPKTG